MSNVVVEHRESAFGRRVRRRRVQLATGIAALEAILVLTNVVPWWVAVVAAVAAIAVYVGVGRDHASPTVRAAAWVAAVSQLIVVLVPVGIVLVGVLALIGVAVLAAVVLTVLLLDRR